MAGGGGWLRFRFLSPAAIPPGTAAGSRCLSSPGWKGAAGSGTWGWALLAAGTAGASLADPAAQYVPGGNGGSP